MTSKRYKFEPANGLRRTGCRLGRCIAGSAPVEYVLLIVFLAIVVVTGLVTLANALSGQFTKNPFASGELHEPESPGNKPDLRIVDN